MPSTRLGSLCALVVAPCALLLAACEDEPPPNPAAGFTINFSDSTATCNLGSHDAVLGVVESGGEPELISNGENGSKITCTVAAAGGGFNVVIDIDDVADVRISVPVLSADNIPGNPAEGAVNYVSNDTGGDVYASPGDQPCDVWIDPDAGQFVRAGEAWISFSCPSLTNEGAECSLLESYIAARNCTGAVAEEEE